MLNVPSVTPAATIAPTNHEALKSDVITARSLGYDSSPMRVEAATMANGMPRPRIHREMTNMASWNPIRGKYKEGQAIHTVNSACLKGGTQNHEQASEEHSSTASESVVDYWNEGECAYSPERIHRGHDAECIAPWFSEDYRAILEISLG
jgi:hypothetical protein